MPKSAPASVGWITAPFVNNKYIHPGMPVGEGGCTALSFALDHDVTYSLDVTAYYNGILYNGAFISQAAYYTPNGIWLVVGLQCPNGLYTAPYNICLGKGKNASALQWQILGPVNNTRGFSVAANVSSIRIVYLEKNATEGTLDDDPIKYVNYYASDNWGASWYNGTLLDYSSNATNWFPGISLAANATTFECMWAFSNKGPWDSTRDSAVTIWEARDVGHGWTTPQQLFATSFRNDICPQVVFNQTSGDLYLGVNEYTGTSHNYVCEFYHLGNGPDQFPTGLWTLSGQYYIAVTPTVYPLLYCAIDSVNNMYYFVNNTDNTSPDGVYNASSWLINSVNWNLDPVVTERQVGSSKPFNLFGNQGPKLFASSITSVSINAAGGLLDCSPPFSFDHVSGSLGASQVMTYVFNGQDATGSTHGAQAYLFNLTVNPSTDNLKAKVAVGVNESLPGLTVRNNTDIISPLISQGTLDSLIATVNGSSYGTASLTVESLDSRITGNANMTDEQNTCVEPAICGDGHSYYLFYSIQQPSGSTLWFVQSQDAGISWSVPRVIASFVNGVMHLRAACKGQEICCFCTSVNNYRVISFDGGISFYPSLMPLPVSTVTTDLSCWGATYDSTNFNITQSSDFGRTWNVFLSIPQAFPGPWSSLEAVAYDPYSGNYSFLIANDSTFSDITFLTSDHVGTSSSVNTIHGVNQGMHGVFNYTNYGFLKLASRQASDGTTEWLILSNAYNTGTAMPTLQPLA
ncbi:MAG TPA: hypothetical protein VKK79_13645, partial [Candidatus Lokiarchaeia archaeon]|nr:hypothetical protein [Candidatus Lokiarchaeia archaeon]